MKSSKEDKKRKGPSIIKLNGIALSLNTGRQSSYIKGGGAYNLTPLKGRGLPRPSRRSKQLQKERMRLTLPPRCIGAKGGAAKAQHAVIVEKRERAGRGYRPEKWQNHRHRRHSFTASRRSGQLLSRPTPKQSPISGQRLQKWEQTQSRCSHSVSR